MDEPLAPALGALAVAGILGDGGEQARIDHARPRGRRLTAASEVARGSPESSTTLVGPPGQRFPARWEQDHGGLIDRRHGDRRSDGALRIGAGHPLLALLGFVP